MKNLKYRVFIKILLVVLLMLVTSGCGRIANDHNFTLAQGKTIHGPLLIMSQNAILEEGSSVNGPVIMLCCNLTIGGSVDGTVFLMSGNLKIEPHAVVDGDIKVMSGNLSQ
jgi:hypothetical protein